MSPIATSPNGTDGTNGTNGQATAFNYGKPPPMGNPLFGEFVGTPAAPPQFEEMRKYRGDCLVQPFRMRERMRNKEVMIGYGLGLATPDIARILGFAGFDYIFIDWEHTPIGIKDVTELIRWISYASEGTTAVVVRVPTHDHNWIAWALDAGASAVILPHTESVEQARAAVNAARFFNQGGHRSYPPFSMFLGMNDGDHRENGAPWDIYNRAAVICQLESKAGADNADAILAVEGVDGCMIGHMDLVFDLGLNPMAYQTEPAYIEASGKIYAAAKKNGDKPVLSFARNPEQQKALLKNGVRMLMVGADGMDLVKGMRNTLVTAHKTVTEFKQE